MPRKKQEPITLDNPETRAVIDDVVEKLSRRFTFGMYQSDDIRQECWVWVMELIRDQLYVADRSSLRTFLYVYLRNKLGMLKRRVYEFNMICPVCENRPNLNCDSCRVQYQRNLSKKSIAQASISDALPDLISSPTTVSDEVEFDELVEYLDRQVPIFLRADYLRLLDGASVTRPRKKMLRVILAEAVRKYYGLDEAVNG